MNGRRFKEREVRRGLDLNFGENGMERSEE